MHCAYTLAICDIVLSPKSSGIKCSDKLVVKRINAFLVSNICTALKFKLNRKNITCINIYYLTARIRK